MRFHGRALHVAPPVLQRSSSGRKSRRPRCPVGYCTTAQGLPCSLLSRARLGTWHNVTVHWSVTLMMRMMIPKAASGVIWAIPSLWHHTGLITPFQGFLFMSPTDVAPDVLFNQVLSRPSCNQGTLQLHRNNPCLWNQRWEASKLLHFKNGSSGHLLWRR